VPERVVVAGTPAQALNLLDEIARPGPSAPPAADLPFSGGWVLAISYDLGRALEPAVGPGRGDEPDPWPPLVAARCDRALVGDASTGSWWRVGGGLATPAAAPDPSLDGSAWTLAPLRSRTGRDGYIAAVTRAIEYIRAGDVYQVNLAHRLSGAFGGSALGFFDTLAGHARPWYGAAMVFDTPAVGGSVIRRAVASLSPELFLSFDPLTRRVTTRPMKGTRPDHASPEELRHADKDRAELNMIVDLMRNDLGRVCRFGSVRVEEGRRIERHGSGVLQGTATVSGRLGDGLGLGDVLRAAFPAGSVTGAPKIRAMQIIDGLEPSRRGLYCGAIGYVSDCGRAGFSVAIRTATITGEPDPARGDALASGRLDYSVGAGIVADSDPGGEWAETLVKARVLARAATIEDDP
jgi:para-aminobenzoate synthetase component 1